MKISIIIFCYNNVNDVYHDVNYNKVATLQTGINVLAVYSDDLDQVI